MSDLLYSNYLMNRKIFNEFTENNKLTEKSNSIYKRQQFLKSNPDALTDKDLTSHRNQILSRRIFLFTSLVLTPAFSHYYFKQSLKITASATGLALLLANIFNVSRLGSRDCKYSHSLVSNYNLKTYEHLLKLNGGGFSNPSGMWKNLGSKPINMDSDEYYFKVTKK
jgi:hypothetical protein